MSLGSYQGGYETDVSEEGGLSGFFNSVADFAGRALNVEANGYLNQRAVARGMAPMYPSPHEQRQNQAPRYLPNTPEKSMLDDKRLLYIGGGVLAVAALVVALK